MANQTTLPGQILATHPTLSIQHTTAATTTTGTVAAHTEESGSSSQPSAGQRMISACAGSLFTSLLVTPLDVVKTRLQSQTVQATPTCAVPFTFSSNASAYEKLCTCCREVFFAPNQPGAGATGAGSSSVSSSAAAGIRQNIANVLTGSLASKSQSYPQQHSHHHDHHHHRNHNHNHARGTSAGCGPSISQQHSEGTVVGMKASQAQQQRLEQLAANCVENNHAAKAAQERYFHGTWDGVKKIVRYEGASSLWRGLSPTLAMSVPATVIYFVGYDYLKVVLSDKLLAWDQSTHGLPSSKMVGQDFIVKYRETLAPLAAGGFARTVAATVISPLELFRTRMQSVHTDTKGNAGLFRGVSQGIVAMVRSEGVLSLWRGLAPTLWRDVPFSAIYWMGYENIKKRLVHWDNQQVERSLNEFEVAFLSGALSGMFAATVTTPFDVAKTRRQVDLLQPVHTKMFGLMRAIVQEEGYRGLWRGLTARVAKVAPSCAIMISSYEIGKKALSEQWWDQDAASSSSSSSSSSPSSSGSSSSASASGTTGGSASGNGADDRGVLLLRERHPAAGLPRYNATSAV
ncbi:solute carrier family 25, member 39/40 [Entomortierella parvispora]|uniref:Solute carrier family 25, member 39/40 n=1 Tax=Entomortierella parvispora TaxID=205924 RepID=A0A9P3LXM9_9FUNG|nr:solute carrier family 25, member 39/40 [Entomortierella parvispora]